MERIFLEVAIPITAVIVTTLVIAIILYIMYLKGYCCWKHANLTHIVPGFKAAYSQQQQSITPSVVLKAAKTNCIDLDSIHSTSIQKERKDVVTSSPDLQSVSLGKQAITDKGHKPNAQYIHSRSLPSVGYTLVRPQPTSRSCKTTSSSSDISRHRSKSADCVQNLEIRRENKHKGCKSLQSPIYQTSISDYEVIKMDRSQNVPEQIFNRSISCDESISPRKFSRCSTQVQLSKDKLSHTGTLNPCLIANLSDLSSIDEMEEETSDLNRINVGTIELSIIYNSLHQQLRVTIIKATGLKAKLNNEKNTINPYVKISLLPGKKYKQRSQVKRKTFNPQFNQILILRRISLDLLSRSLLYVSVNDFDHILKHDLIGEVFIPLNDNSKLRGNINSYNLKTKKHHLLRHDIGEICIALLNQTVSGHVLITILKARNLPPSAATNVADTYVKVYVLCDGRRLCKKKTRTVKNSLNPVFNQQFAVQIEAQQLERATAVITLASYDRFMRSNNIGQVVLSLSRKGLEREHWYDVINSPHRQSAIWHKLHH